MPHFDGALQGDGVDNAAVEHRLVVHPHDGADVRQGGGGFGYLYEAAFAAALGKVFGLAREAVSHGHLENHGVGETRGIVEGQQLMGQLVVKKFAVEDAVLRPKVFHADIAVFLKQVDVRLLGPATLPAHVGKPVARPGGNTGTIGESDVVVQEKVEHTRGEHAAHTSTFQHQTSLMPTEG